MSEEKVFDLMEAANELTAEDSGADDVSTEVSNVDGQAETNPSENTEEADPREIRDYPPTIAWESSPGRYQALWYRSAPQVRVRHNPFAVIEVGKRTGIFGTQLLSFLQ